LREIEAAIEDGQTDEAVAHCRHILETFPKHTETYRLLGKAYLEAQRYGNAADIFQRVLSALPDDFVSHVGMSIIREDEGNLDTALWHMERAFEVQPYNPAIQGEVRRLYGKRDGMEPAKARLTRGALARTYAKGNNFEQAIAELRAALAEEPDRSDLQVILAEMYAHTGETVKAIETCSTILKNLPYCLQANRLLGKLLQGTDREDESKSYLQRAYALEPYEAHISSHAPTAEDVPDQAVTIQRLGWDAAVRAPDTGAQPEWASSLGVELEKPDSPGGGIPDWLAAASEDSPVPVEDDNLTPSLSEDEIPEWMKDAGWEPSSGDIDDDSSPFSLDDDAAAEPEEAVAADLPDWVKDMAPEAAASAAAAQVDDEGPDFDTLFNQNDNTKDNGSPDWMKDIQDEPSTEPEPSPASQEQDLPDWMSADAGEAGEAAEHAEEILPEAEEGLPDWLGDAAAEDPTGGEAVPQEPEATPKPARASEEMPDWLKGIDGDETEGEIEESESTGVTDFLLNLRQESSEDESEQPAPQADEADDIPDWLKGAEPAEGTEPVAQADSALETAAEDGIDWLKDLEDEKAEVPVYEGFIQPVVDSEDEAETKADDIPDWLKAVEPVDETLSEAAAPAPQPETPAETVAPEQDIPDWLKSVEEPAEDEAPTIVAEEPEPQVEAPATPVPDWLETLDESETAATPEEPAPEPVSTEAESEPAIPDWLDDLAGATLVEEADEAVTQAQPQATEAPDWLSEISEETVEPDAEPEFKPTPESMRTAAANALEADDEDEISLPSFEETQPETEPEQEFPEWLSTPDDSAADIKTGPTATKEPPIDEAKSDEAFPEWLESPDEDKPIETKEPPEVAQAPEPDPVSTPAPDDDTPDWLRDIAPDDTIEDQKTVPLPDTEFEDADAAMAWLEGLAAKQGVSEEELLSSPEERPEAPPDWMKDTEPEPVKSAEEPPTPEPVVAETEPVVGETEPVVGETEPVVGETEPVVGEVTPEDIPEWLQDSAFASADADTIITQPAETAEESQPDAHAEDAKWLEDSEEIAVPAGDEMPDWLKDTLEEEVPAVPEAPAEEPIQAAVEESDALPDWLKDVPPEGEEPEDATWIREFGKEVPSFETVDSEAPTVDEPDTVPEGAETPEEPLPGWLQGFDDQPEPAGVVDQATDEEYAWRPSEAQQPSEPSREKEKIDLNQASLVELERLPGMGFRRAQAIFSHREEHGAFSKLDDLLVLGIEAETIAGIKDLVEVKPVPKVAEPAPADEVLAEPAETVPTPVELPTIAPGDAEDEHHAAQIEAQSKLSQGDISGAMDVYDQLIKKGKRIDEIITDLEAVNQVKTNDPEILQALGDAYTRADRLQAALDTYSKVEQLLQ